MRLGIQDHSSYKKTIRTHTHMLAIACYSYSFGSTVFVVSSEMLNSFGVFIVMWLQTPQGPRITVVLWSNLRKRCFVNQSKMRKNLYFRGSRVGPCTDAPTLASSIPSFYSQVHDMSVSIAHEKRNAPQAFTLTHESSDLAHKTSPFKSATQNHNKAHTHITVLLFTRHPFKCRSRCFECCVPLLA